MPTCFDPECACNQPVRKRVDRKTEPFRYGQSMTLARLRRIPDLTITVIDGVYWFEMNGHKAPGVISHGFVSIRTAFTQRAMNKKTLYRECIPVGKRRNNSSTQPHLRRAIRDNAVEFAEAAAQYVHDA